MNLEEIFTFEHLYESYKEAKKSKQHKGEVIRFEANLAVNLNKIINELKTKKYNLSTYRSFYIYEPKKRHIEALPFKDRIVIKCFCDIVLKSKIEPKLIFDNCACRKNKGTDFAIQRLHKFLKKEFFKENNNCFYYLKCDITKYFPSIDHNILIDKLKHLNFSEDEMWFNIKLIKEQPNHTNVGLPLGNQSSQWFALLYLNEIDHYIKEKLQIKGYVRYMDDMVLISRDKKYLQYCKNEIEKMCKNNLRLNLNNKTQVGKVSNGIDFLGYRHILNSTGKIFLKMRTSSKIRMKRHLKTINKLYKKELVDQEYVNVRKNAFYNHIKDTIESKRLKNDVFPQK